MSNEQLILTTISGTSIGAVAGYIGSLMLSKKMSATAGPLAHLAFPGVALAIIFGYSISLGVFPFIICAAVLIWTLEIKTKLPTENLAAIIFASSVGTSLLFLPIDQAEEALIGNIESISLNETIFVIATVLLVLTGIRRLYKRIMLMNINENIAIIEGVNIRAYNLLYLLCVAVVVSLSVYLVGGLITAALIAIPAASSRNLCNDLRSYKLTATVVGAISAFLGVAIAYLTAMPIGPITVVVGSVSFVLSLCAKLYTHRNYKT